MQDDSLAIRRLAWIQFEIANCKGNFNNVWPLSGQKTEEGFEPPTKEWWEKMKVAQAKVDKKIQHERSKNRD